MWKIRTEIYYWKIWLCFGRGKKEINKEVNPNPKPDSYMVAVQREKKIWENVSLKMKRENLHEEVKDPSFQLPAVADAVGVGVGVGVGVKRG